MRLGLYADLVYRVCGGTVSTDRAFALFVTALRERGVELTVFGRLDPIPGRSPYALPEGVGFVPLPHYPRMTSVFRLVRGSRRARSAFARELAELDAVWLFGPHPLAVRFARIARRRQVPVFLGVRQDFPAYIANRLPSRRWLWAVPVAHLLEQTFRRQARNLPTVVLGDDLARKYRRSRRLLVTGFSLARASDVLAPEEATGKPWAGPLRILTVGRLDAEKNPLLLPVILALLAARDDRWRLAVVGEGPLRAAVAERAAELGVGDRLELHGYVPSGPELTEHYRASHAFLHVSRTEGLPQVLVEAQAAGLPVVATDVGGVRGALLDGAAGILVPPDDADAAAEALERLRREPGLRRRLILAGLQRAASETTEAQLDRLVAFFASEVGAQRSRRARVVARNSCS